VNTDKEVHDRLAEYIRAHPDDSFQVIAGNLGVASSTVSRIAKTYDLSRGKKLEHINLAELQEKNNG
jgi:hypothetical protein